MDKKDIFVIVTVLIITFGIGAFLQIDSLSNIAGEASSKGVLNANVELTTDTLKDKGINVEDYLTNYDSGTIDYEDISKEFFEDLNADSSHVISINDEEDLENLLESNLGVNIIYDEGKLWNEETSQCSFVCAVAGYDQCLFKQSFGTGDDYNLQEFYVTSCLYGTSEPINNDRCWCT